MGKDVEEGEISDTASVEEISEEVFNNNQEVVVIKETKPKGSNETSRVWTMRDLYNKYPSICRGYASAGLYNLAWAQAVQNKPLNDIFVMEVEQDDAPKRSSPSSSVASVNSSREDKKEVVKVVIDDSGDEKEEGELEEGEIDLDSEWTEKGFEQSDLINVSDSSEEKRLELIREALESVVNVIDDKSFQGVCLELQNILESLREVNFENNVPRKDALIQLSFSAVQAVNSVFSSMKNDLKEQNKDILSRLLSFVKSHDPSLFLPEQMKEIEAMVSSLDSLNILLGAKTSVKEREVQIIDGVNKKHSSALAENVGHDSTLKNKIPLPVELSMHNKPYTSSEASKSGVSGFKSRGLLPLLDLHKDHDADSLPSPTRETTPCIPARRTLAVGDDMGKSGSATAKVANDLEDFKMHYDETDALRAVSSYQQKFSRSSFFSNELPSPTPSEESGDGDGDTGGEISSSSTIDESKLVNRPIVGQETVPSSSSSSQQMDICSNQGLSAAKNAASSSGSNPIVKASLKSRDPRLRFNNSDALDLNQRPAAVVHNATKVEPVEGVLSSRKQKNMEDFLYGGPALKRQRNGMENSGVPRDAKAVYGGGGWLEDTDTVGPQITNRNPLVESSESVPRKLDNGAANPTVTFGPPSVVVSRSEPVAVTVSSTTASLPSLLKDIAVNPTMLVNILKMGQQQKLAAEAHQKSNKSTDSSTNTMHPPSLSLIHGATLTENVAPSVPSGVLPKPIGPVQVPSQAVSMDEFGKVRMKPRDPRRVLHGNALQRSGSLGPDQVKTEGSPALSTQGSKGNLNLQRQQGQLEAKPVYSQSVLQPDITQQFTKNLKNIADIMSVSQALTNQPMVSQNLPSQPAQTKLDRADVKAVVSIHEDQQTVSGSTREVGPGPQTQNAWGDVEHLFEKYDDQQKAAIQRERARRIEEQKKMFAARKLCLVLDLDHTLLNSAKFNEVDPVHDEILRKKEEQDREKPQRHLFRFPHMGMWTKLRPGIWNFLERASKLYELHLYTMGNKLYATEMAKVLDPKGVLFSGRVISRGDDGDPFDSDERVPKSKDLEGVLGLESGVVIVDDSVRVWPHNKLNLIVVERYIYFPCSRRQFGLPGPSLLEIDHDERPEDGTLASSLAVIERIHQNFFSHQTLDDVDVRNILASEQRKILAGCRIVFSRVFPIGEANPHLHPLWQTAEQFGATCTAQLDEQVTHVVANCLGTDKVNWALSTGRHVVHPNWVEASALLYRRANEYDFAIKQP